MKKVLSALALLALTLPATAKTIAKALPAEPSPIATPVMTLGNDLLQQLAAEEKNLIFSPLSIHMALSMTSAGARGETLAAINNTLGYDAAAAGFDPHAAYREVWDALTPPVNAGNPKRDLLNIANVMYVAKDYPVLKPFAERISTDYRGTAANLDFAGQPAESVGTINKEIATRTNQRITNLLSPTDINADTRLVLVNTVYLKADWAKPFTKEATSDQPFTLKEGKTVTVPTMQQTGQYSLYQDEHRQVLEMPYRDGAMSMLVVLSKKPDGYRADQKEFAKLADWAAAMKPTRVAVSLPKLKMDTKLPLNDKLESMKIAFTPQADFGGISTHEKLCIGSVLHQANIDIDEKGTEAAAATAVSIGITSAPLEEAEPVIFNADHPYLFALRHNPTGTILFVGRVIDPTGK